MSVGLENKTQQCYIVTKYFNTVYKYLKYLTTEQCIWYLNSI